MTAGIPPTLSVTSLVSMPTRSPSAADELTSKRKDAHLDLCATEEVAPAENTTLFDELVLLHNAMPELAVSELDLGLTWFGKRLRAPVMMTGMTGGSPRAGVVNRQLAQVAEEYGVAFGVGSQRAMAERAELAESFQVRDVAPNVLLVGNVGLVQAIALGVDGVRRLMDGIAADAIALHLNPGQELTQPEGDRDFRGGYELVGMLVQTLGPRLLVKETGCGLTPDVVRRLVDCGVTSIDVSGLGGTSWVRVEQLRSSGSAARVGEQFSSWGVPTAAALLAARRVVPDGVRLVASGGLRTGLDVAKAVAAGADVGGMALPFFRAQQQGGLAGVRAELEVVLQGLRQAFALTGCRDAAQLRRRPFVRGPNLREWVATLAGLS
jgi:isopentenyl-diphosphate Delta-isomerase